MDVAGKAADPRDLPGKNPREREDKSHENQERPEPDQEFAEGAEGRHAVYPENESCWGPVAG